MAENKVRFNLKNVHYAKLTVTSSSSGDSFSWATPVHVPGAVSLSLSAQGALEPFYADGIVYYRSVNQDGSYNGDLEMARFPDQMHQDLWHYTLGTTSKVLTEMVSGEAVPFALLFQLDGDAGNDYYCLYNCTATKPTINAQTTNEGKNIQTQSSTISADALSDGSVLARTTGDTPTATKSGWFTTVFRETASPSPNPGVT